MQLNDKRFSPFKRRSKQFSETDFLFIQLPFLVSEKKKKIYLLNPKVSFTCIRLFCYFCSSKEDESNQYAGRENACKMNIWTLLSFLIAKAVFEIRFPALKYTNWRTSRQEMVLFVEDINISLVVWQHGQPAGNTSTLLGNPKKVHYTKAAQTLFPTGCIRGTHTYNEQHAGNC